MLALPQQSATYGLLCTSTQWHKRIAKKEAILVKFLGIFNGKMDHEKYKNQQSNVPSGPQKI